MLRAPREAGDLVEGLPYRVVARRRKVRGAAMLAQLDAIGMAAADHEGQKRRLEVGIAQPRAVHVAGHVRDADDPKAPRQCGGLGEERAHQGRQPINPGPRVTATASTSSQPPGSTASAASTTGAMFSRCARAASSGDHTAMRRVQRDLR